MLLGVRNAPKLDTKTSSAEVLFGVPLRVPGACFQGDSQQRLSPAEQLELARTNAATFLPEALDMSKFRSSPFMARSLRTAKFVYVRDDRLGKASLAPRYLGPFRVIEKKWESNVFRLDLSNREDDVSLTRLKAAFVPEEAT